MADSQPPGGGTMRSFGNMLKEHKGKPKPKGKPKFSPWTKMYAKKEFK